MNKTAAKAFSITGKITTVLLAAIIFISVICAVISERISYDISNYKDLTERTADSEYEQLVYDEVYSLLDQHMSLIVIKPDDISHILTKEELTEKTHEALSSVLDTVFMGKQPEWTYKNDELYAYITEFLKEYAQKENIEYTEGSDIAVYDVICETVTDELKVIPDVYALKLAPLIMKLGKATGYWYVFVAAYILCAAAVIYIGKRSIKDALYNIALPSFLGAFTLYAASAVIYSRDILSVPVLNKPPLRYLIRTLYNSVLYDIKSAAFVIMICFAVLSLTAVIIVSIQKRPKAKPHND